MLIVATPIALHVFGELLPPSSSPCGVLVVYCKLLFASWYQVPTITIPLFVVGVVTLLMLCCINLFGFSFSSTLHFLVKIKNGLVF
jgi:hypothetical protein